MPAQQPARELHHPRRSHRHDRGEHPRVDRPGRKSSLDEIFILSNHIFHLPCFIPFLSPVCPVPKQVFETNTAFDNSGVSAELRLVHAYREETYDESAGASAALEAITFTTDGEMDDVHAKRAEVGADLVALIGSDFTSMGLCGVAWLGPSVNWMFSVTDWSCATGEITHGWIFSPVVSAAIRRWHRHGLREIAGGLVSG